MEGYGTPLNPVRDHQEGGAMMTSPGSDSFIYRDPEECGRAPDANPPADR